MHEQMICHRFRCHAVVPMLRKTRVRVLWLSLYLLACLFLPLASLFAQTAVGADLAIRPYARGC